MYKLQTIINNPLEPCLISEVAFHPQGTIFAITYGRPNNEVRIYDTKTLKIKYILKNPIAKLDEPHLIYMTKNHLIVGNSYDKKVPTAFNIYRLDSLGEKPIHKIETPYTHLREAHSIDMHNDIIAITYCEGNKKTGTVVSYHFDDEKGEISEPISICNECFKNLGDTKGVSFNSDGSLLYITFESQRNFSVFEKKIFKWLRKKDHIKKQGIVNYLKSKIIKRKNKEKTKQMTTSKQTPILKNGLAVLQIDNNGVINCNPLHTIIRDDFCRLENVTIYNDDRTLLLTDTINNKIFLYDLLKDPELKNPTDIITKASSMPHGAKLSPDLHTLVVTNYGLNSIKQQIHWGHWTKKRGDNVLVYTKEK